MAYLNVLKSLRHDVDEYHIRVAECTECPLHCVSKRPPYASFRPVFRGNVPCDLLLVFPSPRRIDTLAESPLAGLEGDIIDEIVNALLSFYPRMRVGLIPAVHCYPFVAGSGLDEKDYRDPTKHELTVCYNANISRFIELVNPSIIVLFGETLKKYFPRDLSHSVRFLTVRHPTNAIKSRNIDDYKREVFHAIDQTCDEKGEVFCCNKPAKFAPRTKR